MVNLFNRRKLAGIGLLLLPFALVLSLSLSAIAMECEGPNLSLSILDTKGEVINLTCAYYWFNSCDSISSVTDGGSHLDIDLNRIREISIVRDQEGKALSLGVVAPHILAVVKLKDGDSRKIFIKEENIVGYDSWGKHSVSFRNIQTVHFE
jgi:hypothetical protein